MSRHLLQICNVGNIMGGTAACAWSVTQSLLEYEHTILFRSSMTDQTRTAFQGHTLAQIDSLNQTSLAEWNPDYVVLHNIHARDLSCRLSVPTIQYLHSQIKPAAANLTICCSKWLANKMSLQPEQVCTQGVPQARQHADCASLPRGLRDQLVIGRICTPHAKKWPASLLPFYERLAKQHPIVHWEFVGCPASMRSHLSQACSHQVRFHEAAWQQRSLFWHWDSLLYHHPRLEESFGRTVAESLRCGCIPIVDRKGGFQEQLPDDVGFLCGMEQDFSQAIESLWEPAVRWKLSRRAFAWGNEQFSHARFREKLLRHMATANGMYYAG